MNTMSPCTAYSKYDKITLVFAKQKDPSLSIFQTKTKIIKRYDTQSKTIESFDKIEKKKWRTDMKQKQKKLMRPY